MTTARLGFRTFVRGAGARLRLLRVSLLCALVGFMGFPVGEVHSSTFPRIVKLHVEGNDLKWIKGVGAPGQHYWLWVRQRNFKEDDKSPLNFNCAGNTDQWIQFTDLEAIGGNGTFVIPNLDLMVIPPGIGTQNCYAALFTEFIVGFGASEANVPTLHMFNIPNYLANDPENFVEADMEGADRVGLAMTDGPDDTDDAFGGMDMDEDGYDLCAIPGFGCGARVSFLGSGGTFASPAIVENDSSEFGIPPQVDKEYKYILSMAEAHGNGGSFLAAAKTQRDQGHLGPSIDVNVNLKASFDIDCQGGLFDFF
jgi:hypothetical protein